MTNKRMKKIIDWFFYLIGLFLITELLHELYHYAHCGGEFIAGIGYLKGQVMAGGYTWCATEGAGGEIVPNLLQVLLIGGGIYLKKRGEE